MPFFLSVHLHTNLRDTLYLLILSDKGQLKSLWGFGVFTATWKANHLVSRLYHLSIAQSHSLGTKVLLCRHGQS